MNVLLGNPLKTSEVWKGEAFGLVQSKLGDEFDEFDSVKVGPTQADGSGNW